MQYHLVAAIAFMEAHAQHAEWDGIDGPAVGANHGCNASLPAVVWHHSAFGPVNRYADAHPDDHEKEHAGV